MSVQATLVGEWIRVADVPVVKGVDDFDAFYQGEYASVLGLGIALSGSRATAEELAQDAFMAAFKDWERIGRLDKPAAWVRRAVANRAVSRFRKIRNEAKALLRLSHPGPVRTDQPADLDVWNEVRRLPRRQAQVVVLTYFVDLPRSEVADTLECSEDTVKTHLRKARKTLAGRLGASLELDEGHTNEP